MILIVLSDLSSYLGLLGILPRDDSATADTEMYVLDACNDEIDTNEAGYVQDLKNAKEIKLLQTILCWMWFKLFRKAAQEVHVE